MDLMIALAGGYILDLILGDPHWLPHPVRLIGWMISKGEACMRRLFPNRPFLGGMFLAILVVLLSFAIPFLLLWLLRSWNRWVAVAVEAVFCYQILATKSLKVESMRVYKALQKGDLPGARKALSWIVGRDTEKLDERQVSRAAVETVAENTSDGVIAPLFYLVLGGAPLGFFYKSVNTLDSMIGYKNDKYLYFGRFAAKMDDVVNFIPAILSAWLMIAASFLLRLDGKNAIRIYRRDHKNHASPNSARTESVAAGALRIQLAGDATYFGKLVHKPTIGDPLREIETADIPRMNRLMVAASVLAFVVMEGIRLIITLLAG